MCQVGDTLLPCQCWCTCNWVQLSGHIVSCRKSSYAPLLEGLVCEAGKSFCLPVSPKSLYHMVGPQKCFLGCVIHTWLVWFVIVWSPSPTPGREPSNPVSPWGLGLGLHVAAGALCEHGKSPWIGGETQVLVPTLLLIKLLARPLRAPVFHFNCSYTF